MSDIRDKARRLILSLNEDETYIAIALLQSLHIKSGSDGVEYRAVPDKLTKADCKRLIKAMRVKQACITDAQTQEFSRRAINHIRNVWMPQIKSHDQKAG